MKRFEWIDTLKGIGIVAVVASHIYSGEIREFIGIFCMPLFFFVGGFLYSPKYNNREYLTRKLIHLIIPYVAFIILLYPVQLLTLLPQRQDFSFVDILKLILNPIIGGSYLWGLTTAFWFLPCFFITQQLANFLIKKFDTKRLVYCLTLMMVLSCLNYLFFQQVWLPQNAHVALAATPIFLIGFLFQRRSYQGTYYFLSIPSIIISLLLIIFHAKQIPTQWLFIAYDMKRANYGIPAISLLLAIGLILFCIDISKLLVERVPLLAKILGLLGQASLLILCLHMTFIYALRGLNLGLSNFNLFILSTTLSLMIYLILLKFSFTRAVFLGSSSDFKQIFLRKNNQPI
jgi:fucose 4-O-acetylase-like acetyltransferase